MSDLEPHSIRLTRNVSALETHIVRRSWRRGAGGFRRLMSEQARSLCALAYDPHFLTVYDRAVIHAVSLAHERPAR